MTGVDDGHISRELVRAAKELIEERLADADLTPPGLARDLHTSQRTLYRAFAETGESVAAHIRRRRVERAKSELAEARGRPNISELAAKWNFADASHFIRAFKEQYGWSPGEYARAVRGHSGTESREFIRPPARHRHDRRGGLRSGRRRNSSGAPSYPDFGTEIQSRPRGGT